jgi:arabinose-5-phosphate isomerase
MQLAMIRDARSSDAPAGRPRALETPAASAAPSPVSALSRCLAEEAAAIADAARRQDPLQVEAALELLAGCHRRRAKLLVSGVGKSGIVARKIAATFTSLGLTALYLNPLDALHGDLGIVAADDVVLLLSNSGESEELLAILPHLHRRGSRLIGLLGNVRSRLARLCPVVLDAAVDREVCPLNLAPTASTAVAMAIGDALAAVWIERAGITAGDFAANHPGGALGRQLCLTVADLMVPAERLRPLFADASLEEVIVRITANGVGAACVLAPDDGRLLGLITDGDLRRTLQRRPSDGWSAVRARDMMTVDPLTITPAVLAVDALELMEQRRQRPINLLPVVDADEQLLGILRLHELVQAGLSTGLGGVPGSVPGLA